MTSYVLTKKFDTKVKLSPNVAAVSSMFGLGNRPGREMIVVDNCKVKIESGQVVYITGGSGAGKSQIFKMLYEQMQANAKKKGVGFKEILNLGELEVPTGRPLVDCFIDDHLSDVMSWLSMAGLSDAFAVLRNSEHLSDGQRYRFKLALALSINPDVIFIDEFCSTLDRVTAAVVAHNVRKFANRFGTTFVVATSHDDMLEDLAPDVVMIKHLGSHCDVYYPGK
ncbi:MAG: ATP-binding cassette domain-containing protein [Phycisphaerae bacterium]|nr:ATP-binding cassette domain-containing protein [Phycisphaerae bacterium]